jgi:DNA-binding FrmR family transcriptional regulator
MTWDMAPETMDDLRRRLRRVDGQVRGIEKMLAEGRACEEIVTQVSAALHALEQVGFKLIASGLAHCAADPDKAKAGGYDMEKLQKMFLRLA